MNQGFGRFGFFSLVEFLAGRRRIIALLKDGAEGNFGLIADRFRLVWSKGVGDRGTCPQTNGNQGSTGQVTSSLPDRLAR
jgi:hypothetical protein